MQVKELIEKLKKLPQDKEVVITAMDDYFTCSDFELRTYIDGADSDVEIILPYYIDNFTKDGEQ